MATIDSCNVPITLFFSLLIMQLTILKEKELKCVDSGEQNEDRRSRYTMANQQHNISASVNMVEVNKSLPRLNFSCIDEYTLAESG